MTIKEIIQKLNTTIADHRGHESHFESWLTLIDGICEAIDALKSLDNQEPVARVQDLEEVKRKHLVYEKGMDWKDPLYTTPPQRTWVGLTDEERNAIFELHHTRLGGWDYRGDEVMYDEHFEAATAAIYAKLKLKNGIKE